jgi:vacuolar protein sorting-associated protein 13D
MSLYFRVQVIERGGTFFVVFMDSNQMPAPLRIENLSDVPIQFYQSETREELTYLRAFIQPHQSIDYAWDEPTLRQAITCSVLGGTKETYDLQKLGHGENLCYENHICLALEQTFNDESITEYPSKHSLQKSRSINDRNSFPLLNQRQLVIDYIQGNLVLAPREENKRSQLWRMTSSGLLVHTGSSSPRDWSNKDHTSDNIQQASVLDIEEISSNNLKNVNSNTRYTRLTIRRYDPKREVSQRWTFHEDGYLCMGQTQMCVQVFGELKEKNIVVLGPRRFDEQGKTLSPLPTMHIRPHRRLKGSGLLSVRTYADGPTRVLEIANVKTSNSSDNLKSETLTTPTTLTNNIPSMIYHLDLRLDSGIGISIINSMGRESEELVFIIFNNIRLLYKDEDNEQSIDGTIGAIIISNQLLMTSTPCLLYATYAEDTSIQSAVRLQASLQKPSAIYKQLYIFHNLIIGLNSITIQIDEILLWKLIEFFTVDFSSSSTDKPSKKDDQTYDLDEGEYDTQRLLSLLTSTQATRIYFNELSISSINLDLSVYCGNSRSLPVHLLSIKRRSRFPLVRFENAQIHLKSYNHIHIFNTYDFFLLALTTHYVDELKRQAFKILGSVDFLGNPLGLFNDVTDGFASLVDHGSVTGLVKNVAHGVADSTSKFTGTLSYGLGRLALDEDHDDMREAIANNYRGSSIGHVIGGTVGLAAGFIGGLTSLITQPYKSVVEDGVGGLMKGFAKGLVGTVSKPVVGVLDFANGLALAIKEGSRSSNAILRNRIRATRCPTNIFGLLQPYSTYDANGQCLLYQMNKKDLTERYITRITLSQTPANSASKRKLDNTNNDEYAPDRRSCCVHVWN